MAKTTYGNSFIPFSPTSRPDIYQTGRNSWTSVVNSTLYPSHGLSEDQGLKLITNFAVLLNGTFAGDPDPSITLQLALLQFPADFEELVNRYNRSAETQANSGRINTSNVAWWWYNFYSDLLNRNLYQRWGGIMITVRPPKSKKSKTTEALGELDAFSLLDDAMDRISQASSELRLGGERLEGDDLAAFLSFLAMGEIRRPQIEAAQRLPWEVD